MGRVSHLRRVSNASSSSARAPALLADDGSSAVLASGGIELRDHEGRMLLRYRGGSLELAPATGDLVLRAPAGAVRVEAAADVTIASAGDLRLHGAKSAELSLAASRTDELAPRVHVGAEGPKLVGRVVEVRARTATTVAAIAQVVATEVRTSAQLVQTHARKVETVCERAALRTRELAQEVAGLFDSRAGRVRALVKGAFSLQSKTVNMKSEDDTSIDGRHVFLG